MPVFLLLIFVIVIWIRIQIIKSNKKSGRISSDFWAKERISNFTRKGDISSLDYIHVPWEDLPFIESADKAINELQNSLKAFSDKNMLNLSNLTNTEIKLTYGPSNLEALTEYDQNFALFLRTLYQLAECYYDKNHKNEARKLLEYGITCHSDISGNYTLLAIIYKEQDESALIDGLIESARTLTTLMKNHIILSLEDIKDS